MQSRGAQNGLRRVVYVLGRFGVSPKSIEDLLNKYVDATQLCGCLPTFPITGVVLKRHPELVRKLIKRGVEFAIHGYVHNDYRKMGLVKQANHIERAMDIFKQNGIPFVGFRAPYLRGNGETLKALRQLGFLYDSSETLSWDVLNKNQFTTQAWREYENVIEYYTPRDAEKFLALPRIEEGIVEIPVSLPDDEALIDRLGIKSAKEIARIWCNIASSTYRRGELFVIQLHHERISLVRSALLAVLAQARRVKPPVWIAGLGEIARWWKEKQGFSFEMTPLGSDKYRIKARCSERATILVNNCSVDDGIPWLSPDCWRTDKREFVVEASRPPVIGVAPETAPAAVNFLKSEGFLVEKSREPRNAGIYFSDLTNFSINDEKKLSEAVNNSPVPLIRFWRWPLGARSALAVTGDIDSITLKDFLWRFFEV